MRYIKLFEDFKSRQKIDILCTKYNINNYSINEDGSVDVDDDVLIVNWKSMKKLPIKFRKVSGIFACDNNKLTTLEGAPIECNGFYCQRNNLTSLEYSPNRINGAFQFFGNNIYSFEFFPEFIKGNVFPSNNLSYIFDLFHGDKNLIDAFNDYNIIKSPKSSDDKPRLKVSNLNKFLSDNGFKELKDTSKLEKYYDLK